MIDSEKEISHDTLIYVDYGGSPMLDKFLQ